MRAVAARIGEALTRARRAAPAAAPVAAGSDDLSPAYRAALTHSARVHRMRRIIPVLCVVSVFGPMLWSVISPFARTIADVQISGVSVSGSKITMEAPKLSGFRKDQKAYEVTAREAVQDIKTPTVVELNSITARLEQDQNKYARLTSDWGRFDQSGELLDLKGNVRIRTDDGHEVDLFSAKVEMKTGRVVSSEPVEMRSTSGRINADRVELRDNAKIVIFEGRVRSVFNPPPATSAQAAEQTGPAEQGKQ